MPSHTYALDLAKARETTGDLLAPSGPFWFHPGPPGVPGKYEHGAPRYPALHAATEKIEELLTILHRHLHDHAADDLAHINTREGAEAFLRFKGYWNDVLAYKQQWSSTRMQIQAQNRKEEEHLLLKLTNQLSIALARLLPSYDKAFFAAL